MVVVTAVVDALGMPVALYYRSIEYKTISFYRQTQTIRYNIYIKYILIFNNNK